MLHRPTIMKIKFPPGEMFDQFVDYLNQLKECRDLVVEYADNSHWESFDMKEFGARCARLVKEMGGA